MKNKLKTKSLEEIKLIPNVLKKVNALKKLDPYIKDVRFHEDFPKTGLMKNWGKNRINRARKTRGECLEHKKFFIQSNVDGTYDPKNHVAPILVWDSKNKCFEVIDGHHRVSGRDEYETLSFVWCVELTEDITDEQRSLVLNKIACWGNTNMDLYKRNLGTDDDILEIVKQEINYNPNIRETELKRLLSDLKNQPISKVSSLLIHKALQLKVLKKNPLKCVKNFDRKERSNLNSVTQEIMDEHNDNDNSHSYTKIDWEDRTFENELDHDHDVRSYISSSKGFLEHVKCQEKKGKKANYCHLTSYEVKNANYKSIQDIRKAKESCVPFYGIEELVMMVVKAKANGHRFVKKHAGMPQLENESEESYIKQLQKVVN